MVSNSFNRGWYCGGIGSVFILIRNTNTFGLANCGGVFPGKWIAGRESARSHMYQLKQPEDTLTTTTTAAIHDDLRRIFRGFSNYTFAVLIAR